MVGCHHGLDGYELEQALGDSEGQGSPACCSPSGHKESDTTEWLNNDSCMQELLSVSLMVSIKHKPIIDTQKIMRKESKHNATESHQTTREESRKPEKKKTEMNYKTEKNINKMTISTYLLIILNVNGLISPIKRHILTKRIKENKTHLYAA